MSFARNVNFNQMLADKGRRQDEGLALERQKINDDYQIGMINALKQSGVSEKPAATTTAAPVKTPTFSNLIAKGGSTIPTSMAPAVPGFLPLNEGMPGSGTMGRTMFSTDAAGGITVPDRAGYQTVLDETPGLKEGGIIERTANGLGVAVDEWKNWKKSNPVKAGVLDVLPVTGQVTAALDYASAMRDGNSTQAAYAATGLIPGIKLAKYGSKIAPESLRLISKMNPFERAIAPITKSSQAVGQFNNAGDFGQAGAQMYNNSKTDPVTGQAVRQPSQIRVNNELNQLGLRKGIEYVRTGITKVTDPTGNGSPTEDTVDAKLAEGEAVLNAGAAKIVGREGIAALNERGLKEMGMEGAQPEFVDGEVRAYAGIDFNDPAMKESAQNMEMRRRLAAGVRQPVAQPAAPVQAAPAPSAAPVPQKPPIYSVTEMGDPYTKEELVRNAERAKVAQAAQAQAASRAVAAPAANIANPSIASKAMSAGGKLLRAAASAPAAGIMAMMKSGEAGAAADDLDFAPGGRFRAAPAAAAGVMQPEKATGESMTPGDAMRLRRPAEPQYSQQVPVPAGYVAPKPQVFAARGVTKEDRSNYDLAEQGFGGVVRKAGNVYTDAGANPYLNQQFKEHDGMTGQQLLDQRIALDATRQAEAVAKEDKAQLDALEKADPRVRIARIEKEGTAAMKKAEQDAAVNLAREQNPKLTKAQEMAIRYGVKDAAKSDGYKIEMGEVAQALGIPAVDDEGKPISDVMTGRQVVNRNVDAERKFFAWMQKEGITDTNKGLALYMSKNGGSAAPASFASSAEVEAAAKAGQIKPGDKVIVNGRQATWQ